MIFNSLKFFFKDYFLKKNLLLASKAIFESRKNYKKIKNINQVELKFFSQNGEDGIIDYLLESLLIKKPKFIEIGVGDYTEANTRYIFETRSPKGLIIDCNDNLYQKVKKNIKLWKGDLNILESFINSQNIINILRRENFLRNLDLFSLDIDGIDYWVLKKLPKNFSKIAIIEYNPYFGYKESISVPNIKNFQRSKYHHSMLCFGMSIKAAINLMAKKNLVFIGSNLMRNNAFFIRKDLLKKISVKKINEKELKYHVDANFREGRNKKGSLNYISRDKILNEIKKCYVVNLKNNKKVKIETLKI